MARKPPAWFARQSAVIPYRCRDGEIEVVLITTRRSNRWIIPKGVVDPGETPVESAVREALEEAGVGGVVDERPVGSYRYEKWNLDCVVEVFLLEVREILDEWLEDDFREREWVSIPEAIERCREPELKEMLRELPDRLERCD